MYLRKVLTRNAAFKALKIRKDYGLQPHQAICVYDLAEEKLGIKVRFDAIPSMEGMYINGDPARIILSSLRPAGRIAYTCAHEVGHHVFSHGMQVDEEMENQNLDEIKEEEYIAECFAGFLLMPKLAVSHGFARRGWEIRNCSEDQAYIVAGWLGVGYTTLINHMNHSLKIISSIRAVELAKVQLQKLRARILGNEVEGHLIVVDKEWFGRPIDAHIDDLVLFKQAIKFEGSCIEYIDSVKGGQLFRMVMPGIARCFTRNGNWAEFVRVSRREYVGQCKYRHLEEPIDG
jgi:Zn-dependent peptidase ImmA (M78 family)